jgi:quinoprotein glucose dehydrogenase
MAMTFLQSHLYWLGLLLLTLQAWAQPSAPGVAISPRSGFQLSLWAREPMLKNPVAFSFDDQGRCYVVETARRSTVDIDIRSHQSWIVDDLSNQSVHDLRGFFHDKMSAAQSLENARWLRDLNRDGIHDWQDLTMVKERVHWLQDTQGQGKADRAQVFAEGFNEEIGGVIAGVLPWGKEVLVTAYPSLWRLRDTNADGIAELQESMFRGFGVHAAFDGHDLHGLTVGPEGKIYFSVGDNGFSVTNQEGRLLHAPNTGGVLRMNPDGSDLEIFATGLRNPQEIAFDEFGNLFSVDNDGDLEDERERFVYIAEGSDSGWRLHWQFRDAGWAKFTQQPSYNPWLAEKMWIPHHSAQPAHITPPILNYSVGPGSIKYNPGTALNESYRRHFFLIQFPVQKVTAFQTQPKGASFEMVNEHVLLSGMMASALNFGPDGALFVADWDGMWEPNDKGAIWRLDDPLEAGSPLRVEVRRLLSVGLKAKSTEELALLLGHLDQRVRQRAQFELVTRGAKSTLLEVARTASAARLARVHALWGLGQCGRSFDADPLPFSDPDPEIRAQAAKLAGDLRLPVAARLALSLDDESPRVRYHAAVALGKIANASAFPQLVGMLAKNANQDPFLRHAGVMGLAGIGDESALKALAGHASVDVRRAAVLALRRLGSAMVAEFLRDRDAVIRYEAIRAVHDDLSIPAALPALAALLDTPAMGVEEGAVRRLLNANLRLGTEAGAERILRYALDPSHPESLRAEATECLAVWERRPYLDRVEGLVRSLGGRPAGLGDRLLQHNLNRLLNGAGPTLSRVLTKVILQNRLEADPELFASWAVSTNQPSAVKSQALELLSQRDYVRLPALLAQAWMSGDPAVRLTALRLLATKSPHEFLSAVTRAGQSLSLREQQLMLRLLAPMSERQAVETLDRYLTDAHAGRLAPELILDVLEAARGRSEPPLQAKLSAFEALLPASDPLTRFRPSLQGGDVTSGREIFKTHASAQCVRCHEAGGDGYQAGPVLKGIGAKVSREYLLESLIDPGRRIAEGFVTLSLALRDGEVMDGIRVRETADRIVLRLSSGETREVLRRDIEKESSSSLSSMPPMGEVLTLFELRDVIAYLASLK